MSEYVIMPSSDYQAACDSLRAASGKTDLIKSGDMSSEIANLASKIGKAVFKSSTLPANSHWDSVTYGDGKFVAVAYGSDIAAYSTDGINWTQSTLPTSANWISVTYGDGKFVAVASSSNAVAYSTDGINWTRSTLPTRVTWYSVTYGDGKFVAVASNSNAVACCNLRMFEIA